MKYRVGFCLEMGGVCEIEAASEAEAEDKVYELIEESDTEDLTNLEIVHREYWTQDPELVPEPVA